MMENIKMLVVLTLISGSCGLLLAFVHNSTAERIDDMVMKYVKGPAVKAVLKNSDNESTVEKDRAAVNINGRDVTVFLGKKNGRVWAAAYETNGEGYGGELGVIVGYDLNNDKLTGIGVTAHKETPGIGSRVTENNYTKTYIGKAVTANFKLKGDQGEIDALTGATVSSAAVCDAVRKSASEYEMIKSEILKL